MLEMLLGIWNKIFKNKRYEITPKGKKFLEYLEDLDAGKDVYIEEYEDALLKIFSKLGDD